MLRQHFPKPGRKGHGDAVAHRAATSVPRAGYDCQGCSLRRMRRSALSEPPYDRPCVALMMSIIEDDLPL
ncbi:MAG: hypothetical protein KJ621_15265 [Proteobacteria bacterium]|nr:hypothetical protein [Pseudomonadota bacterium]MBU1740848.1 hypothetical protein [Pseudomonadota bacterium]